MWQQRLLLEKNKTCIIPYQKYCVGELKLQTVIFCHEKLDGRPLKKKVYRFNEKLPRTHLYFFSVVIKRNIEKQRNPSVSSDSCCLLTRTLWTIVPPLWCFMLFTQLDYRTTITNTWKHKIRHIAESKVVGKIRIAVTDGLAFFRLVCTAIILRILRGA